MYILADTKFLEVVPLQIADCEGAKCYNVRCLDGQYRSKTAVMKNFLDLKDLDYWDVCTKFTAQVRKPEKGKKGNDILQIWFPSHNRDVISIQVTESGF